MTDNTHVLKPKILAYLQQNHPGWMLTSADCTIRMTQSKFGMTCEKGHEFEMHHNNLLAGNGCQMCRKNTVEKVNQDVSAYYNNITASAGQDVSGRCPMLKWQCARCNSLFASTFTNIKKRHARGSTSHVECSWKHVFNDENTPGYIFFCCFFNNSPYIPSYQSPPTINCSVFKPNCSHCT